MRHCPDCGKKLLRQASKHCPECGIALSSAKESYSLKSEKGVDENAGLFHFTFKKFLLVAGIILLIVGAFVVNVFLASVAQYMSEGKSAQQKVLMQEEVQMYQENLERQQIAADSAKKAELEGTLKQFLFVMQNDVGQMGESVMEYNTSESITDKNLERKAAVAKKFALQVNEFYSHVDGMMDFFHQNKAFIERFSTDKNSTDETAMIASMEEGKAAFRSIESLMREDLEKFASTSPARMGIAAQAIQALSESEALP